MSDQASAVPLAPLPRSIRRRRVPTILQMEAVECGAAALGMILAYHGLWLPLETLRDACKVSRDGTSAAALLRAARSFGMKASGWRVEPAALAEHRFPAIAFWELNHFVVIEGVSRGRVRINDPAYGRRTVDAAEFDAAFTGVLLTFEPTEAFQPGGRRPSLIRALLPRGPQTRAALSFLAIIALCNLLPPIFVPAASKIFADNILVQHATSWLRPLLVGLAAAALLSFLLSLLHGLVLARLQRRRGTEAAIGLMAHMLRLPIGFFVQRHVGDVTSRMEAARRLSHSAIVSLSSAIFSLMGALTSAAIMMMYDLPMALACIAFAAIDIVAIYAITGLRVDGLRRVTVQRSRMASVALGGIQSIETIKASGAENEFFARLMGAQAQLLNALQNLERSTLVLTLTPSVIKSLSYAVLLGWGALKVMDGDMTVGTLIAFLAVLQAFHMPVQALVGAVAGLQDLRGELDRVQDTLRHAPADTFRHDRQAAAQWPARKSRLSGRIEIRDLSFAYPGQTRLLEHLALDIEPGRWVALVGTSGSGKSTLARLVAGLLRPDGGRIRFDDIDLDHIPRRVLAGSVSFVQQDVVLFEGTVRENIALWDPALDDVRIHAAARDALIHDDITRRRGQYGGAVAEGGANFSGGQRQRIELARALATDPAVLILDEASAALDPVTEAGIFRNLRRRGVTALVVSHRLSTIRDCDEIIVLDAGRIVQRGSHDSLIAAAGPYADLVRAE
ncbi:NHLP family bacteriocin export ABC transporter peptidase/permease/ATPase subunit [Phreatobacter sp. AB_2022a]|uniref:NHLP family bacteriocin export ABC transporter peptidase/permease/ATPase subunit n=1 Tax=Phreatobacter sp. AB_2022a TaxID=3003134 RepID=UPI0022876B85|nr:NHLP family bacteriocin export ABC transporter peptidase/permease/ATPase subunit [Phreatobacter sp. AB_2022a]MCZ0734545.1 NHLP family bacteriocin export ABC transporter peptidase/permease/ATPase subunit [Phreatobacter sp. AB_2022a]